MSAIISSLSAEKKSLVSGDNIDLMRDSKVEKTAHKINLHIGLGGALGVVISGSLFILFFAKIKGLEFSAKEKTFGALSASVIAIGTVGGVLYFRIPIAEERSRKNSFTTTVKLEVVEGSVPWDNIAGVMSEPDPLPEGWQKHVAKEKFTVSCKGVKLVIGKGEHYYTHNGKIVIGWHGTYNPPLGM